MTRMLAAVADKLGLRWWQVAPQKPVAGTPLAHDDVDVRPDAVIKSTRRASYAWELSQERVDAILTAQSLPEAEALNYLLDDDDTPDAA